MRAGGHWGAPLIGTQPACLNSGVSGATACGWPCLDEVLDVLGAALNQPPVPVTVNLEPLHQLGAGVQAVLDLAVGGGERDVAEQVHRVVVGAELLEGVGDRGHGVRRGRRHVAVLRDAGLLAAQGDGVAGALLEDRLVRGVGVEAGDGDGLVVVEPDLGLGDLDLQRDGAEVGLRELGRVAVDLVGAGGDDDAVGGRGLRGDLLDCGLRRRGRVGGGLVVPPSLSPGRRRCGRGRRTRRRWPPGRRSPRGRRPAGGCCATRCR